MTRRGTAVVALACGATTIGLLALKVIANVPRGATAVLPIAIAGAATWYAATHAFRVRVPLPQAPRPTRAVVFWNPRSGGGKAVHCHLADEARARGLEPIELTAGASLEQLVYAAIDAGADAVAMAGGDGSQAVVARIAAERGIPYACIPAGTRNHFARDLGVDPDDIVGALDAFVDGAERIVDLGEVNGRTFVNNVSLGVYGAAVQRAGYRDAKVKTVLETAATAAAEQPVLRWRSPDGIDHEGGVAIIISNNAYRPGPEGARPRLDEGRLGVTAIGGPGDKPVVRTWTAASYEIDAPSPVPAGVDGEAVMLDPPLQFKLRSQALRCRIARHHPGASRAASTPTGAWGGFRNLAAIAAGRAP